MKQKITLMALLLASAVFYWGCNQKEITAVDNTASNAKSMEAYNVITKQIADAKAFFVSTVDTNVAQKFKKTALWDNAYIAHFTTGDRVVIPFAYDKNYNLRTSNNNNQKLSLQKQTHLFVYKNANGTYAYDIVTMVPDLDGNKAGEGYSGLVLTYNWADKLLSMDKYKNGIKAVTKSKAKNSLANSDVTALTSLDDEIVCINYYYCAEGWNTLDDCMYIGSDCSDGSGVGGSGGSTNVVYIKDSMPVTKTDTWLVAHSPNTLGYWEVKAYEILNGIKIQAEPQGGHFTGITHTPAKVLNYSTYFPPTYTLIGEHAWIDNDQLAKSNVSGSVSNGVSGLVPFNPTKQYNFITTF